MTAPGIPLDHKLTVLAPEVRGPLAVYPVAGPKHDVVFRSFRQAAAHGASVRELPGRADVNRLLVCNPLDVPVLLYEGEEVQGAQQDRTVDVSVLVPAGAELTVPVTCVEAGRWDGTRHHETFKAAPQASYPALRRLKNRAARASGEAAAAQGAVWAEVADKSARHGATGHSGAMRDVFDARRESIAELVGIELHECQRGSVCVIGGQITVLDYVGCDGAYAALHGPLLAGYALDAVEHAAAEPPPIEAVQAFVDAAHLAPRLRRPAVGLGDDARFATERVEGAALLVGDDVVALTAFACDHPPTRVRRPSHRRPA